MAAKKKEALITSPNEESDGKMEESSTPTSSPPEPSGGQPTEKQSNLPVVKAVLLMQPMDILNLSSRTAISQTQGLIMWEGERGIMVISQDKRVKGIDLIPWANCRKVKYE